MNTFLTETTTDCPLITINQPTTTTNVPLTTELVSNTIIDTQFYEVEYPHL